MKINLGANSYIGSYENEFDIPVEIGKFCSIGNHLTIVGSEHPPVLNPRVISTYPLAEKLGLNYPKCSTRGGIEIGNDVWIGQNVILLDGIKIGTGAIIGAGSVVTKDVGDYQIWAGNPAQFIRHRYNPMQRVALKKISWWNWEIEKIKENESLFSDISLFIQKFYNE